MHLEAFTDNSQYKGKHTLVKKFI